jgi:hypothetical protein
MSNDPEIMFPDRQIKIGEDTVTVRELKWKQQLDFFAQLGAFLKKVQDEKGEVRLDIGIITDLIKGTTELVDALLAGAIDKDAAWLEQRRTSEVLAIIEEALELNLQVLKESGKRLAGRLKESGVGRTATPAAARSEAPTLSS